MDVEAVMQRAASITSDGTEACDAPSHLIVTPQLEVPTRIDGTYLIEEPPTGLKYLVVVASGHEVGVGSTFPVLDGMPQGRQDFTLRTALRLLLQVEGSTSQCTWWFARSYLAPTALSRLPLVAGREQVVEVALGELVVLACNHNGQYHGAAIRVMETDANDGAGDGGVAAGDGGVAGGQGDLRVLARACNGNSHLCGPTGRNSSCFGLRTVIEPLRGRDVNNRSLEVVGKILSASEGEALAGLSVQLLAGSVGSDWDALSDGVARGICELTRIVAKSRTSDVGGFALRWTGSPGEYVLRIARAQYVECRRVSVRDDKANPAEIHFGLGGEVRITSSIRPCEYVTLTRADRVTRLAGVTSETGELVVRNVPSGHWIVHLRSNLFDYYPKGVAVADGVISDVTVASSDIRPSRQEVPLIVGFVSDCCGYAVCATPIVCQAMAGPQVFLQEGKTDQYGFYRIVGVPVNEAMLVGIVPTSDDGVRRFKQVLVAERVPTVYCNLTWYRKSVEVVVLDADGLPFCGALGVRRDDDAEELLRGVVKTNQVGHASLRNVPPGTYRFDVSRKRDVPSVNRCGTGVVDSGHGTQQLSIRLRRAN